MKKSLILVVIVVAFAAFTALSPDIKAQTLSIQTMQIFTINNGNTGGLFTKNTNDGGGDGFDDDDNNNEGGDGFDDDDNTGGYSGIADGTGLLLLFGIGLLAISKARSKAKSKT